MQYTLDSVHHFVECLKNKHKSSVVTQEPILYIGAEVQNLNNKNPNKYYFGILTVSGDHNANLKYSGNVPYIEVSENSQIIEGFQSVSYQDNTGAEIAEPIGFFRGFEITIQN